MTKLNERDLEVLSLVVDGLTTDQIAKKIHLSPHAVQSRKKRIMKQLGAKNMTNAVYKATPDIIAWRESHTIKSKVFNS